MKDNIIAQYMRPVVTIVLVIAALGVAIFDPANPNMRELAGLAGAAISFYIGSRGMEKVARIKSGQ